LTRGLERSGFGLYAPLYSTERKNSVPWNGQGVPTARKIFFHCKVNTEVVPRLVAKGYGRR
jgi:hypothetical protein